MRNKKEFIEVLAKKMNRTQKDTLEIVDVVFGTLVEEVLHTGGVKLSGFGTFKITKRAARKGKNPQTGEEMSIPEKKVIKFGAATKLQDAARDA